MTTGKTLAWAGLIGLIGLVSPAAAHHSFAMFDQTKLLNTKGTVSQFRWTNPHSFLVLDVNGTKYTLTQNGVSGTGVWIHFYNVPGITGEAIPVGPTVITGVNKISYSQYYLIPRTGSDIGTGLAQYLTENDVTVYPNPVADQLTVTLRTDAFRVSELAIYDLNGKLVTIQPVEGNQISVNAARLVVESLG